MDTIGLLRQIADNEVELMRVWRNAPDVRRNMYTRHEISYDEHVSWWRKISQQDSYEYFMYEFRKQPLGIIGLSAIDRTNSNSSWAFYASPNAPKGTGTKMEYLALDYAFSHLKLHKLYCEVLAFNEPVIKLHKKFGFQVEGMFIQHHKVDDKFTDVYRLALFSHQWSGIRKPMLEKILSYV